MATFNGALYVEEQLRSILSFLDENDEIVVSDDGSTDGTIDKVAAMNDGRITILTGETRLGYQRNFERAVRATRGQYIFFSDQDDICLSARIPRSLEALARSNCVCGDAIVVDADLRTMADSHFAVRKARFSAAMMFVRPSVIGATLACRRAFLFANLPFPDAVPHDMWLSIQAARRRQLVVVREPFILYRRHVGALSATGTTRRRKWSDRLLERLRLAKALISPWPDRVERIQ